MEALSLGSGRILEEFTEVLQEEIRRSTLDDSSSGEEES